MNYKLLFEKHCIETEENYHGILNNIMTECHILAHVKCKHVLEAALFDAELPVIIFFSKNHLIIAPYHWKCSNTQKKKLLF